MQDAADDDAEKFALVNARLDTELKQLDLLQRRQPWRSLTNPTTVLALLTAFVSFQSVVLSAYQASISSENQKKSIQTAFDMSAHINKEQQREQRLAEAIRDEHELVASAINRSDGDISKARTIIRALAAAGLLDHLKDGLYKREFFTADQLPAQAVLAIKPAN